MRSTKTPTSILSSSPSLLELLLCLRKKWCLFLSPIKQDKLQFTSSGVKSPPLILVSSTVSYKSIAILIIMLSASKVLNS